MQGPHGGAPARSRERTFGSSSAAFTPGGQTPQPLGSLAEGASLVRVATTHSAAGRRTSPSEELLASQSRGSSHWAPAPEERAPVGERDASSLDQLRLEMEGLRAEYRRLQSRLGLEVAERATVRRREDMPGGTPTERPALTVRQVIVGLSGDATRLAAAAVAVRPQARRTSPAPRIRPALCQKPRTRPMPSPWPSTSSTWSCSSRCRTRTVNSLCPPRSTSRSTTTPGTPSTTCADGSG